VVSLTSLRSAGAGIAAQISRWRPGTAGTAELPSGFTIDIIPPALVYGTAAAPHGRVRPPASWLDRRA
jgi:hypothetical protein